MKITVCIPTIPPRRTLLIDAINSVTRQTHPVNSVSIANDIERLGAGPTRQKALEAVKTDWIAFLDDDDWFGPDHIAVLVNAQIDTGADVLWPWFEVVGGSDPFPMHFGRQFNIDDPHIFPIATLVRTELILDSEAQFPAPDTEADWHGDDFPFWLSLAKAGGKFHHVPERTWYWRHHGLNTSGLPSRW